MALKTFSLGMWHACGAGLAKEICVCAYNYFDALYLVAFFPVYHHLGRGCPDLFKFSKCPEGLRTRSSLAP